MIRRWLERIDQKRIAAKIANEALHLLRQQSLDCVNGSRHYDVSQEIHTAVLHAARDVLREQARVSETDTHRPTVSATPVTKPE